MKKITLLFAFLFSTMSFSQKIVENKIDDFTKKSITRTNWENLSGMSSLHFSVRVSKINDSGFLNIKIFTNAVTSITEKDEIMLMAESGEILTLHSLKYVISGYGDGANGIVGSKILGMDITCSLSEKEIEFLKNNTLKKVRLNSSQGYLEDDLKIKNSVKLKKMLELLYPN